MVGRIGLHDVQLHTVDLRRCKGIEILQGLFGFEEVFVGLLLGWRILYRCGMFRILGVRGLWGGVVHL